MPYGYDGDLVSSDSDECPTKHDIITSISRPKNPDEWQRQVYRYFNGESVYGWSKRQDSNPENRDSTSEDSNIIGGQVADMKREELEAQREGLVEQREELRAHLLEVICDLHTELELPGEESAIRKQYEKNLAGIMSADSLNDILIYFEGEKERLSALHARATTSADPDDSSSDAGMMAADRAQARAELENEKQLFYTDLDSMIAIVSRQGKQQSLKQILEKPSRDHRKRTSHPRKRRPLPKNPERPVEGNQVRRLAASQSNPNCDFTWIVAIVLVLLATWFITKFFRLRESFSKSHQDERSSRFSVSDMV